MVRNMDFSELDAKQEQLIYSLLKEKTKEEAARKSGTPRNTMYRWLRDPVFKAAYRAALQDRAHDCRAVLEKNSPRSAQALVDVVDDLEEDTSVRVTAAKAVIDRTLPAQDRIAVEEELAGLRATIEQLRAIKTPARIPVPTAAQMAVDRKAIEHEQAEADHLRVTWMAEIGSEGEQIAYSLRYNQPTSVSEEQELLNVVRKMMEFDEANPKTAAV